MYRTFKYRIYLPLEMVSDVIDNFAGDIDLAMNDDLLLASIAQSNYYEEIYDCFNDKVVYDSREMACWYEYWRHYRKGMENMGAVVQVISEMRVLEEE